MANMKQDGSNITSVEFSTARCRVQCEQCFVNYGQVGGTVVKNIMDPRKVLPGARGSTRNWLKYATTVKDDGGKLIWRLPQKGTVTLTPKSYGWDELTEAQRALDWPRLTAESAFGIPKVPDKLLKGPPREPAAVPGGTMPWVCRVSSMSDSAQAPLWWCQKVLAAWGDQCFFNAAGGSACSPDKRAHWDSAFARVVITANGGWQELLPLKQFGEKPGLVPLSFFRGSMGERAPGDFLDPLTIVDRGLPASLEQQVKFYRLRALPTIQGRLETSVPVVITQFRLLGLPNALEFCRKYGIDIVPRIRSTRDRKACAAFGVAPVIVGKTEPCALHLRYNGSDNVSAKRGAATIMRFEAGYYRSSPDQWDHLPYVCDRTHWSCVACGLCASLDGTQPGGVNQLNVLTTSSGRGDVLMAPEPYGADYLPHRKGHGDPNYYASIFTEEDGRWVANPDVNEDWIAGALEEVAGYLKQGLDADTNACESWNTHEDVRTLTAFCYWNALKIMKRNGVAFDRAVKGVEAWFMQVSDSFVLDDVDELRSMWDGESAWTDTFGEV